MKNIPNGISNWWNSNKTSTQVFELPAKISIEDAETQIAALQKSISEGNTLEDFFKIPENQNTLLEQYAKQIEISKLNAQDLAKASELNYNNVVKMNAALEKTGAKAKAIGVLKNIGWSVGVILFPSPL